MQERPLRSGFTTGTCGAAAAKAAAVCLLTGEIKKEIEILTPKGVTAKLAVSKEEHFNRFRVQKDSGDDPDVTNQVWVYASIETWNQDVDAMWYQSEHHSHLYLTGGEGIGVVTRPGLACPIGKHAINPVPRQMIFEAVESVCEEVEYTGVLVIRIWIPEGVNLAEKTFNPKLGVVGGISVLGTSGIVEPMSEQALLATIQLEIHIKAVEGLRLLILTPGNYGENFLRNAFNLSLEQAVKCSNFVADAMKIAANEGILQVLFVGHLGKLIKIAGGVANTHSKYGDRRMEIISDCVRTVVGDEECVLCQQILQSNTTEEALDHLENAGCRNQVMAEVVARIRQVLSMWSYGKIQVEVVTFSLNYGILGKSKWADDLIDHLILEER